MKKRFLLFLLLIPLLTSAQNTKIEFEFLPEGLHFLPLKANFREARIGVMAYTDNLNLKVDLGNSIDLLKFTFPSKNMILTFGMEFMAYALATDYNGLHLQIDAIDGFFGGSATFSYSYKNWKNFIRLRIIHNSAHLVDGHYDLVKDKWIDDIKPIPFTRDFGELLFAREIDWKEYKLKAYAGPTYSTLVRPQIIKKWSGSFGLELANSKWLGRLWDHPVNAFLAFHSFIMGTPEYNLTTNYMLGVKFGEWNAKGVIFYISHYIGNNIFSEYYYNRISRTGIGFFVDFN